jgi:hypothetical protein
VAVEVLALWIVCEERLHSVGAWQERSLVAGQLLRSGHHRDAAKVRMVVVVAPSGESLVCKGLALGARLEQQPSRETCPQERQAFSLQVSAR